MIKVLVSNNMKRNTVIVEKATSLRQVLDDNGVDYSRGTVHLDGSPLRAGDLDKSFESFGLGDTCCLTCVVKADNA